MTVIWILVGIIGIVLVAALVARRWWEIPGPQTALIFPGGVLGKSGGDGEALRVVVGKPRLILPPRRHKDQLSLAARTMRVLVECETKQMLRVGVHTVVNYRIGEDREFIQRAALRYLERIGGENAGQLDEAVENIIRSEVRAVIGNTDFELLISRQSEVIDTVREVLDHDFNMRGLIVDKVGITQIDDHDKFTEGLRAATEYDIKLRKRLAEHSYDVNADEAKAAAAEKRHALRQRSDQLERDLAKSDADNQRYQAQLESELRQQKLEHDARMRRQRAEHELAIAELERKLTLQKADEQAALRRQEIELERLESETRTSAEVNRRRQLNELEVTRLLQAAQAAGIELQGKIAAMDPEKAEQFVMLTIAEKLPEIAKAAKVELPALSQVIQGSGGETNNVLSTLTQVGVPIMEMVRAILKDPTQVTPHIGIPAPVVQPVVQPAVEAAAPPASDVAAEPGGPSHEPGRGKITDGTGVPGEA